MQQWEAGKAAELGGWQGRLEPRAPLPGTLGCNVPGLGALTTTCQFSSIRSGESGDLDFTSAKMSLSCLFNSKPHECSLH